MIRPFQPDDHSAVLALGVDAERIEDADELLVAVDERGRLTGARDLRVMGRGDEPVLILETGGRGEPAADLFEAVLPRAVAQLAERGCGRAVLQTRCAADDEAARRLFERFGFRLARELWSMACRDLAAVEQAELPEGVVVRSYAPGQHDEQWREAFNEAFADHWGGWMLLSAEYWRRYVRRASFDPTLSLVAWDGDEIAGFCHCRLDEPTRGQVRYVGVRPGWRRRGLAEALTRLGMVNLRRRGAEVVTLGVDATNTTGAQNLYERLGFAVVGRHLMYRRELCASSTV